MENPGINKKYLYLFQNIILYRCGSGIDVKKKWRKEIK